MWKGELSASPAPGLVVGYIMLHIIDKGLGNKQKTPFLKKKARQPDAAFLNIYMKIIYLQPHIFSSFFFSFFLQISPLFGEVFKRAVLTSAAPLLDSHWLGGKGWAERHTPDPSPFPPCAATAVSLLPLPALPHCIPSIIALNKTFLYIYLYV